MQFREQLKADILEQCLEKEIKILETISQTIVIPEPKQRLIISKKTPQKPSWWNQWKKSILKDLMRWGMIIGGTTIASIAIFPIVIPYFSPPTQANQETIIRNITGTVAVTRDNNVILLQNTNSIFDNDIIITGDNSSAEIILFDGSIIRVAPHSKLVFDELTPHPFLLSSGGISVSLEEGMIWMKTFSLFSETSQISVQTADLTVIPSRAAFVLEYSNGMDKLQVWKNNATVAIKGLNVSDSIIVKENESLQFSPFDKNIPQTAYLDEKTDFVNQNLEKDIGYTKEFLERITAQMKEEYIMDALSSQIHTYLENNSDPDSVEYLISELNNLILVSHKEEIIPEQTISEQPKYLPLQKTSSSQKKTLTKTVQQGFKNQQQQEPNTPQQIFTVDNLTDTPKTAQELSKAYQEQQKTAYQEKVSQSFVEQVNQFSFSSSRKTKAKTLLNNLPQNEESLSLLQKIESISPEDVKEEVQKKRNEIEKKVLKNAAPAASPSSSPVSVEEEEKGIL